MTLVIIFVSALLINNFVLAQFLGICSLRLKVRRSTVRSSVVRCQ